MESLKNWAKIADLDILECLLQLKPLDVVMITSPDGTIYYVSAPSIWGDRTTLMVEPPL